MYDEIQLIIDLKTIVDALGTSIPHGFYTKRVFDRNGLYIERNYRGFDATYKGVPINTQSVAINSDLGQYVLMLVTKYEEQFQPIVIKHSYGSATTFYG